jgi:hypothetical protein
MILNFKTSVPVDLCFSDQEAIPFFKLPEGSNDITVYKQTVELAWTLEFDTRDWGIKDAFISVPDQDITFLIEFTGSDEYTQEKEVAVHLSDVHISIQSEDLRNSFRIDIESISLDTVLDGVLKSTVDARVG